MYDLKPLGNITGNARRNRQDHYTRNNHGGTERADVSDVRDVGADRRWSHVVSSWQLIAWQPERGVLRVS